MDRGAWQATVHGVTNIWTWLSNSRLDKQNDLAWKLFGKVPLGENAQKDSKKLQKVYEIQKQYLWGTASIYEPCINDHYWGFEIGKLCFNLYAKYLLFKSVFWVRKIPWWRKWQSTPVFLPGESHGWGSLVGYSPQGRKESGTTERLHFTSSDWARVNVNILGISELKWTGMG